MTPRITQTANFRLALLYAGIFSVSVAILGIIVFYSVRASLHEQLRNHIEAEIRQLLGDYNDDGLDELRHDIHERIESRPADRLRYSIQDAQGRIIFDKLLPDIPPTEGWYRKHLKNKKHTPILLYAKPLKDGYRLAVAADLDKAEAAQDAVRHAFSWALLFTLVAGAAGGTLVSRRFLSQIDSITQAADRIGASDLSGRLPIRGTGDDLDELAKVINRMLDRIRGLMENVKQVSTSIAHDLRTPLGHLKQTLEKLEVTEPENTHLLQEAIRQVDRMLDTFTALLRIAEIESGSRKAGFRSVNISELTRHLVETYQPVAEEFGQSLMPHIHPDVMIQGDKSLLVQMLSNLLENSIKYSGLNSFIEVRVEPYGGIVVSDNGPGIPVEEREHVLKPFYRVDRSRHTPGSGLGLSLAHAIATLHDMKLDLADANPGLKITVGKID